LFAQDGDAFFELVHAAGEFGRLAGVARRAVTARELVELIEQVPRVTHVAPNCLVAPAQFVGVKAQVQLDQRRDLVDHLLGVLERGHTLARHLRAHHVVETKGHSLAGDLARRWFAHVVKQGRQAQDEVRRRLVHHGPGVLEDVLVLVHGVLFELELG